ncbi:PAAR domain-containing protein [Pseudomonas chlororaphis]|uniref:PAAR domain-containing protein n=1 Tax=Pseudomonas chlororaphis TaxID=587753 RepID=UPI002367A254|nr:PAAR domain-containing protein [Pseudomonas chlororaphis]WDG48720.1 PAAR domain-containing protein [Pseudomonas chlororaphis]
MSGKPAARVTDPTACPLPGHGTNPIASGSPDVLFDGLPAARLDDPSACEGKLSGNLSATVFINGKNAATVDSLGTHGNVVIGGSGTIIIGDTFVPSPMAPIQGMGTSPFKGRFRVFDRETGKAIAGQQVRISSSSGESIQTTDAEGYTSWVNNEQPETLKFDLIYGDDQ